MKRSLLLIATAVAGFSASASWAQNISVGNASGTSPGPTTPVTVPVTFTRNAAAPVADFTARVTYNTTNFDATAAAANGGGCSVNEMSGFVTILPPPGGTDTPTNVYCNITFTIAAGVAAANYPLTPTTSFPGGGCFAPNTGDPVACTFTPGQITVTPAGGSTPPTISYNPITGTTINYTGAGTATAIVATPSGGSGTGAGATTTVGACTISGGGAAFPTTNIAQLSFVGSTTTPQNIALPNCVPQAAAVNATLTCPEAAGGGAAVNRVWTLNCPAAAPAGTPPTITYNPAAGSTSNVAAGANLLINVGCPTDGSPCNGSGTGNAATARLQSVAAVYTGLASPAPSMACTFVSEGGAAIGSPLDFVALAADPGDARCTCPMNTTGLPTETFRIDITEISPIGGTSNVRQFNVVCGAPPPACGTLAANPASGTINLVNGGAGSTVSTFTLTGAGAGVTNTITCATSGVSAGTAFTVTTNPSPLTLANNASGTVTASCTNSEQTTGTGTLTCTATSTGQSCMPPSFTYTLSCPGQSAPPPPGESVPVPAMSEQGRILLAALVLLLGLGVVGFRMRG